MTKTTTIAQPTPLQLGKTKDIKPVNILSNFLTQEDARMLLKIALLTSLLSCIQVEAGLNYRTCKCVLGTDNGIYGTRFSSWSEKLRHSGWFNYVSCSDVRKFCPGYCQSEAWKRINADGSFDGFCKSSKRVMLPPNCRKLIIYSQLMNNCGATMKSVYLHKKLCCMYVANAKRWIGYSN